MARTIHEALYIYERNGAKDYHSYQWFVQRSIELYGLHQKFMSTEDIEDAAFICPILYLPNYFRGWSQKVRCLKWWNERETTIAIRKQLEALETERTSLHYAIEIHFMKNPEEHLLEEEEEGLLSDGPDEHQASIVSLLFSGTYIRFFVQLIIAF